MSTLILGIDPGSRATGYGLIDVDKGKNRYVQSGCIRVTSEALGDRLNEIFSGISSLIEHYSPAEVAIEKVFMAKNPDSALKLGQARGVAIVAAARHALPVSEYSARQVKQAVVGKGSAEKSQVQHMVVHLLELNGVPQSDAADALAIALCHAHTRQSLLRFGSQGAAPNGVVRGRWR